MAQPVGFSKDFSLNEGIFTSTKITLSASTNANALEAILAGDQFPDGDIEVGRIAFTADTGKVSLKPDIVGGASVSFDISASAQAGMGVYGKSADAIKALALADSPSLTIPDGAGQRFLLMDWGYAASFSGSASHPIGMLGTVTFGVDAQRDATYAVLHRFDAAQSAHAVVADTIASWLLPRFVAFDGGNINLKPATWLLVEADGSLALTLAASMGWNVKFAQDAKLLGITHNLSAKVDASLKANFGFNVSGKYVVVVAREDAGTKVRLQLWKQSTKGLNFGFNVDVGVQGADPQLPANFDDFIKSTFGVHGLQVLQDLRTWTDPSTDIGQKLAGLADQTALDLLKKATGIDPAAEFNKAKQLVANALNTWTSLPDKLSSMLWTFLGQQLGQNTVADFKTFLTDLSNTDPQKRAAALAQAIQKVTFGDTPEGQFLEAIADRGLLALSNELGPVSILAGKALDVLNGGIIANLQAFINQKLDLNQIRQAVTDADFNKIEQWLQNRLGNFLDKTLGLEDLKDIQKAITTLDQKIAGYYKTAVQALTKKYNFDFAAAYQQTTSDTALIDVYFDLAVKEAADLFTAVVVQSNLDKFLISDTPGVTLNQAQLTHEIKRQSNVDLQMPFFDFSSTHVNDAIVTLTAEEQGGRLLLYQIGGTDTVTVANRSASQLSVLAPLKIAPGQPPQLATDASLAYEMRLVKTDMRPADLESRTTQFIHDYLAGLFSAGDASIRSFYTDLDNALTQATHNQSNHLGDMALSMQLALPAGVLTGWFQPRSGSQLTSDQMRLSRALQGNWKHALPALFFQDLSQYQPSDAVAALLVWSSLPVSTSIDFNNPTINRFNTDKDVFWDWPDVNLRRAIARDPHTSAMLGSHLTAIHNELLEAGSGNAGFFDPTMAGRIVEQAIGATGDIFLQGLLFTEARLVRGATDALEQISAALATAATAPTQAIKTLANFAADLTDTFNQRVGNVYSGISGRVVGPMLLVESSAAIGSIGAQPSATLTLYALNPNHTFDLSTFLTGKNPPKTDVALAQNLVSLS
ncbi:MAG TPA: hypothetical protein VKU01_11900 [Bryobacteraceae bacterium]|nr:hypothetical protein [Bryobacteraceae bacterium]